MSVAGIPDTEKAYKKSQHHRKSDSEEELDVFEAARYFSGANEMYGYTNNNGANCTHKVGYGKDYHLQEKQSSRAGRFSLDMPMRGGSITSQNNHLLMEKAQMIKEKKKQHKQPSSPGGKLAHFLNSLFSQTSSRNKKKSKSTTSTQSTKDEDQSPGWRRKRRSSISHFQSTTTTTTTSATAAIDSKSVYSLSSSGFRTPPPYSFTPTKSYKEFRSHSEHHHHQKIIPFSKQQNHVKSVSVQNEIIYPEKKRNLDYAWLDDKLNSVDQNLQSYKSINRGITEKSLSGEKGFREFNDDDDGADSDSSSDLFELPNYDLGCYSSSGLPVYETTNMDNIKRSAAIPSGC
ncbi:OLC1v1032579C1 [Oldenlandia corymbosa var. corymbosa]|uniref:OLC1v1032579C1 n=1 Tax=Oldenlandia corymbosa var. corymbosa TaxID=529605 RepID=A0AAV1CLE9_OLDCO|nr:OLC1v1032579C1 [Oldenlandia corymbosa var. corymbosa]